MKRIIAAALAIITIASISLQTFAESPLAVSDRITEELAAIKRRQDEINLKRQQQESAKLAALYQGRSLDDKALMNYYINRKTLTKKEFEAFRWSFIFSQFAIPLEDSFLDVFSQDTFQQMINENFTITGVKEYIITDSTDTAENNKEEIAMLQNTNVDELVETIKKNYTYYPVYTEGGNQPRFSSILQPDGLSVYETFYMYDLILEEETDVVYDSVALTEATANSLYYNQEVLGDSKFKPNTKREATKVPIFVYDANSYLYLQLAVGAYCKTHKASIQNLIIDMGDYPLVIDSFGNICVFDGERPLILLPNFGNSILNAVNDEDNAVKDEDNTVKDNKGLRESINLYNKWFTTMYTNATRASNTIYPQNRYVICADTVVNSADVSSGTHKVEGNKVATDHYQSLLKVNTDPADLADTLVLIETPEVTAKASQTAFNNHFINHYKTKDAKGNEITLGTLAFLQNEDGKIPFNTSMAAVLDLYNSLKEDPGLIEAANFLDGMLFSPYKGEIKADEKGYPYYYFAPFNATDKDIYKNKYPLVQAEIQLGLLNNGDATAVTHIARYENSLSNAKWRIHGQSIFTTTSASAQAARKDSEVAANDMSPLISMGDIATLITSFDNNNLILDERFSSYYKSAMETGVSRTEIYLPEDIIDIGQNMSAYLSDEKGMFLADYKIYYSAFFQVFCNHMAFAATKLASNRSADSTENEDNENDRAYIDIPDISDTSDITNCSLNQWNDTWYSQSAVNHAANFNWSFNCTNALSQKTLKYLYEHQTDGEKGFKDEAWLGFFGGSQIDGINYYTDNVAKIDIYKYYHKEQDDDFEFSEWTNAPGEDSNTDYYIFDGSLYYYKGASSADSIDGVVFDSDTDIFEKIFTGNKNNETFEWQPEADEQQKFDKLPSDKAKREIVKFLAKVLCGVIFEWGKPENRRGSFDVVLADVCTNLGANDYNTIFSTFVNLFSYNSSYFDARTDGKHNIYFYDEYQFLLRNPTYLSDKMGCNNSSDFATITYFWDRHYLTQSAWNIDIMDIVDNNWNVHNNSNASINKISEDYAQYLSENMLKPYQYSITDFVTQHGSKYILKTYGDTKLYTPYFYEYDLQAGDLASYAANYQQMLKDTDVDKLWGSGSELYSYLNPETIILYPFTGSSTINKPLKVYGGTADGIMRYASATASMRSSSKHVETIAIADFPTLLMALQCNTDYEHNSLAVAPTIKPQSSHVTKEELMDNANQFFTNPVTSLSYIMSGFLYQIHAVIATGDIGNVFSINWLTESGIYKWIMDRYVAIIAIAVAIILLIKLIQFAMNKSHDFWALMRSFAGILAMCLVPVIIFNSFVWAFDTTSKWALAGSMDKILLSQIDVKARERINSDAGVDTELMAFKEQFRGLDGVYDCLTFEEMTDYSYSIGPIYKQVSIWDYMDDLTLRTNIDGWYTSKGFKPIHQDRYSQSLFYYFYDFIRAEYFNYCATTTNSNAATAGISNAMNNLESLLNGKSSPFDPDTVKEIQVIEQSMAQITGGFKTMLEDTSYVYDRSILKTDEGRYNGPKPKDLVGLYNIVNANLLSSSSAYDFLDNVTGSAYYIAYEDSEVMKATDGVVPKLWNDQDYLADYFSNPDYIRGTWKDEEYYINTSYLDLFNNQYNKYNTSDVDKLSVKDVQLTPFEEKLCALTADIYDTTLQALNYLPDQVHDEAAITLMAMIATCKTNELFGVAPTEPIMESVTLDSFIRTAFLTNLADVGSDVNTMYAMVSQGDSIGKILLALCLELIISFASICRILIIVYITIASFVILGLRLIHKAPATSDLVYGIVGNMMALLALHALTLFLVVVAIEAIANSTSVMPQLLLDLIMIAFVVLVSIILFKLVKNLVRDAINLGGVKIKGMVRSVQEGITNSIMSVVHTQTAATDAGVVNINTSSINQTVNNLKEDTDEVVRRRGVRVAAVMHNLNKIEEDYSPDLAPSDSEDTETNHNTDRVARNIQAESKISQEETSTHFSSSEDSDDVML